MRITDLEEARRNPSRNAGNRRTEGISKLLQYAEQGIYYATFTSVPKVGVNPNSKYSTPVGIYAYPLGDGEIIDQIENNNLPFAGDQPFINVFKIIDDGDRIVGLQDDGGSFKRFNEATAKWLAHRLVIYRDLSTREKLRMEPEMLEKFIWQYVFTYASDTALSKTPGGIWWAFTRIAALLITYTNDPHPEVQAKTFKVGDLRSLCFTASDLAGTIKSAAPLWTRLMRDIGVDGVIDYSGGIIHSNEPTQAVFFSTSAIRIVDRIDNPRQATGRIEVNTAQQFYRVLAKTVASYSNSAVVNMLSWISEPDGPDALFNLAAIHPTTHMAETIKVALAPKEPVESFFKAAAMLVRSNKVSEHQRQHVLASAAYKVSHAYYVGDMMRAKLWLNYGDIILGNEAAARAFWLKMLDEQNPEKSAKMYTDLSGRPVQSSETT